MPLQARLPPVADTDTNRRIGVHSPWRSHRIEAAKADDNAVVLGRGADARRLGARRGPVTMTLAEAFAEIAMPDHPDPEVVARRRAAMVVIYQELMRLQRNLRRRWLDDPGREDVASRVFETILSGGPRDVGGFDEDRVRAYLIRSLANGIESLRRQESRRSPAGESVEQYPCDAPSVEDQVARGAAAQQIAAARERLFAEIVPAVAAKLKAGNTFLETVRLLRAIEAGTVELEDLIHDEFGANLDPAAAKRARNAFDQRFSRVFKRLHDAVGTFARSAEERTELHEVIDFHRLRQ